MKLLGLSTLAIADADPRIFLAATNYSSSFNANPIEYRPLKELRSSEPYRSKF
jgi:hypothetical protein